ncbi:prolyl hydroxylase family protein [Stakelama tenebrarum]|uniref:2OG-Fe(II) oxygenase n=1 Tax=Stakelama tenebrarum TaxID=2711215 RepID=A0A6G6Y287_9SPHN|nr:2OG-Fe(II) oxygenase [Sphingosinithalassobacter tenebrarum]QIG78686.1 2OG-Fe(II) oxygenase [Sphingosinithalassobacter tenebrarum]
MAHAASSSSDLPAEPVIARLSAHPGVRRFPGKKLTLFQLSGFLDAELCAAICRRIDERREPSAISGHQTGERIRTSETCHFDDTDPLAREVESRIADLTGLDLSHGEPMQGQHYAVGQEFREHIDHFLPAQPDYEKHTQVPGNRSWTVMIYLNDVAAGGATRFRAVDKIIRPERGKLLAWCNLDSAGNGNPHASHCAMKVRAGEKYVITKWFRERPYGWLNEAGDVVLRGRGT